jgi:hypothetical protein
MIGVFINCFLGHQIILAARLKPLLFRLRDHPLAAISGNTPTTIMNRMLSAETPVCLLPNNHPRHNPLIAVAIFTALSTASNKPYLFVQQQMFLLRVFFFERSDPRQTRTLWSDKLYSWIMHTHMPSRNLPPCLPPRQSTPEPNATHGHHHARRNAGLC